MTTQIRDYEDGIVYSPIEEFAGNTIRLLNDNVFRKKIGLSGLLYVEKNHDEIALARKLESTLQYEIEKKKTARSKVA